MASGFESDDQRKAFFGKLAAGTLGARKAKAPRSLAAMRLKHGSGMTASATGGRLGAVVMKRAADASAAHADAASITLRQSRRVAAGNGPFAEAAAADVKARDKKVAALKRAADKAEDIAGPFKTAQRQQETYARQEAEARSWEQKGRPDYAADVRAQRQTPLTAAQASSLRTIARRAIKNRGRVGVRVVGERIR